MLCQEGYPCVYMTRLSGSRAKCALPRCVMERYGNFVHDTMTDRVTRYVTQPICDDTPNWEHVKRERRKKFGAQALWRKEGRSCGETESE